MKDDERVQNLCYPLRAVLVKSATFNKKCRQQIQEPYTSLAITPSCFDPKAPPQGESNTQECKYQ